MSDNEEKQRPNAGYQLSNEKDTSQDQLVFHYDRERRLAKAPQAVRDLYKEQPTVPRFNLFKPLVRTKHLTMLFISIMVASVFIIFISVLGLAGTSYALDGNQVSIQAIKYEGAIIVVVKKTISQNGLARFSRSVSAYTGAVDIAVQPLLKAGADETQQPEDIFYHKIFFTFEPEEYYRFAVPFDADDLALVFKTETKTLSLTVKAE